MRKCNPADFTISNGILTKYDGKDSSVVIPDGVTEIGARAFSGLEFLEALTMPDSVRIVREYAFYGCKKLKKIDFSKALEVIGTEAFSDCSALAAFRLPDSIREIHSGAFVECPKLKLAECTAKNVKFAGNPFTEAALWERKSKAYDADGFLIFDGVLFDYQGNADEIRIPDTVHEIYNSAFERKDWVPDAEKNFKKVTVPSSVRRIGRGAFRNCGTLQEIELPAGIEIADSAFDGCEKLTDENGLVIVNGTAFSYCGEAETLQIPDGVTELAGHLFEYNGYASREGIKLLKTVLLPETLKKISCSAFQRCESLEKINLPSGLEEIGALAFAGCTRLNPMEIPASVTEIGDGAFLNCRQFADQDGWITVNGRIFGYPGKSTELSVPEGITQIAASAFSGSTIASITLPKSLQKLGAAFHECKMLEQIVIPEGITEIAPCTFEKCTRLRKVSLPESLRRIGNGAFSGCEVLAEIDLPEQLECLGDSAFENCTALKTVTLPAGVRRVPKSAFSKCTALEAVTLREGTEQIGEYAFSNCRSLQQILLPKTLSSIESSAFDGCACLKKVPAMGQNLHIGKAAFNRCRALADETGMVIIGSLLLAYTGPGGEVTVPQGVTEIYPDVFHEGAEGSFRNRLEFREEGSLTSVILPSTVRKIHNDAFRKCTALKKVVLAEGLEHIGSEAFFGCTALEGIALPDSVSTIGTGAFGSCTALKSIVIPVGTTAIGEGAFLGCEQLEKIEAAEGNPVYSSLDGALVCEGSELIYYPKARTLLSYTVPEQITAIHRSAFSDCDKLEKLVIPAHVTDVGDCAFRKQNDPAAAALQDIEVSVKAGSGKVGSDIFSFPDNSQALIYPRLPVTFVKEQDTQVKLAVGFCTHPEAYAGEYAKLYEKYVVSHEKTLLKKTEGKGLQAVKDFLDRIKSPAEKSTVNYKKLSAQAKVELLENAVLENDPEKTRAVLEGCETFEFTARALGIACEYGSPELVKLLTEHGCTFQYDLESVNLRRKYHVGYQSACDFYPAQYDLMLVDTDTAPDPEYHFGTLPEIGLQKNSGQTRGEILAYLLPKAEQYGMKPADLLYYSLLWGSQETTETLLRHGGTLSKKYIVCLAEAKASWLRNELVDTLWNCSAENLQAFFSAISDLLEQTGQKLILSNSMFQRESGWNRTEINGKMLRPEVLKLLLQRTDTGKLTKSKLLEFAVEKQETASLSLLAEAGWLSKPAAIEKLIAYAEKEQKTEALAWLLDFQNKTVDLAAEQDKKEKKLMRELTADPNSVSELKKIWSYKKQEDGTLILTGYKGSETEITVPEKIGKASVTAIGDGAFEVNRWNKRIQNMDTRKRITSVTLPEGVSSIGESAFLGCGELQEVTLPSTIKSLGESVFGGCAKLKTVRLPSHAIDVGKNAFSGCTQLADADGFIVLNGILFRYEGREKTIRIPDGVREIWANAFPGGWAFNRDKLTRVILPEGLEKIGEAAFQNQDELKEINWPSGLRVIGKQAFENTGLYRLELPDGVEKIGAEAFSGTPLKEVFLPADVTAVGAEAFACAGMKDLWISAKTKKLGANICGDAPFGLYVHTEEGSAAAAYMKQYRGVAVEFDYKAEK